MDCKTEELTTKTFTLLPFWCFAPARDMVLQRLVAAIIRQAVFDARKTDETGLEARAWLLSLDCEEMCDFINFDRDKLSKWVDKGCPDWRKEGTE